MELDGDVFGFKIKHEDNLIQEDFPISIDCFRKNKYQSGFFNEVVQDIVTYALWKVND